MKAKKPKGREIGYAKRYKFNGELRPLTQWASIKGMPYVTLKRRLDRGWSFERAITEPVHGAEEDPNKKKLCIKHVCERCYYYGGLADGKPTCGYIEKELHRRPCLASECVEKGVFRPRTKTRQTEVREKFGKSIMAG